MNLIGRLSTARVTRQGIVLFTVIAILAVVMIVVGGMLGHLVREHRQCRLRHTQRQCRRLAEAAVARAVALRANDSSYTGEIWTVGAANLSSNHDASVAVRLEGETLTATAAYPAGDAPNVRYTETFSINHKGTESTEEE